MHFYAIFIPLFTSLISFYFDFATGDESIDSNKIQFELYTRKNPQTPDVIRCRNDSDLENSNFDSSKPVKIYSHGWFGSSTDQESIDIKDEILKAIDANVILIDWSRYSQVEHDELLVFAPKVGKLTADFLEWMYDNGMKVEGLHLIGFSMGSHVSGMAGRTVKSFRVPHITGCDPPGFPNMLSNSHYEHVLTKDDAEYVESVHTSSAGIGQRFPLSHVDFYLDGGDKILTCPDLRCSHVKGVTLFKDSINRDPSWIGKKCQDFEDLIYRRCNGKTLAFGGLNVKEGSGMYDVDISDKETCRI